MLQSGSVGMAIVVPKVNEMNKDNDCRQTGMDWGHFPGGMVDDEAVGADGEGETFRK